MSNPQVRLLTRIMEREHFTENSELSAKFPLDPKKSSSHKF